ncbi:MAG TPA: prolipoprotein diacylglyceryl transferase family protein [Flavitalea sp.]|nr:prolipoprotein diacylglyceryl transferase family protein [Flavitalea sp.]
MYPNLYYAFEDLFGIKVGFLRFVNSFGFFVALAFLLAAYVLTRELKRKERDGLLQSQDVKITVGQPASTGDLILNFFLGFILGYKIIGLFLTPADGASDPQKYIFSAEGNWVSGILLGVFFLGVKWFEKNKQKLAKPEERTIRIWPHDRVGDIVIYAALFGFLGAKLFHNFENWSEFIANPIEALLSFSGLTFYGGLICATLALWYYARKHKFGFIHLCDAAAPALIIAYAVGRIGCQVSGDGDWGILNSAYVTDAATSKAVPADTTQFHATLQANTTYYQRQFPGLQISEIHQAPTKAPSWLPDWMFAFSYPHNVLSDGVRIPGCEGDQYCSHLPIPVYPTPFYETIMGLILFAFLWSIRSRLKIPGTMFAVYLMVNGLERFLIETIRVNNRMNLFGLQPTQAEVIAVCLSLCGLLLFLYLKRRNSNNLAK